MTFAHELVAERRDDFWVETLMKGDNPGIFLHYLQDTFAHDGFASYVGHAGYFRIDFMASDCAKAERMAMSTLKYLIAFREVWINGKPIDQFSHTERIDLSKYMTAADVTELRAVIDKFVAANPSKGVTPNEIVIEWAKLSEKDRRERENFPPPSFVKPTYYIAKDGPSPDSYRARAVVVETFKLKDTSTPYIWVYDLKDSGAIHKVVAEEAYVYKKRDLTGAQVNYTSDDEKGNKDKRKIYDLNSKRQCLPFKLVATGVLSAPVCR
jgi:hypothetical protein